MRIVDRQTFLALPAGTVFAKFAPQPKKPNHFNLTYDEVAIKGDTMGNDFWVQDTFPDFEGSGGSDDHTDMLIAMLGGATSPPLDYNCEGRDGLYDGDQLFAIWDRVDVLRLIERLQEALADGYGVEAP